MESKKRKHSIDEKRTTESPTTKKIKTMEEPEKIQQQDNFSAGTSFDILNLSDKTREAISKMGFTTMTQIQANSIPKLLKGEDLIGSAKTGSGKTLSFLIPIVELLSSVKFKQRQGTGALIITPTRELALQIYGVLEELIENRSSLTCGILIGGANRKTEGSKLVKGVSILVCTPGRLLDHLQNTKGFVVENLQILVMDEADRILEVGFEQDMKLILNLLPKTRQTMLFSATQDNKVEGLAKLAFKNKPIYIGVDDNSDKATVIGLEQGYVMCNSEERFLLLFTFLKKNANKKIMVFFSSCNSVKYHSELLNYIDLPVLEIHGKQKQQKRTSTFYEFCKADKGILLCTDVAARGLDIPKVDWIIQFDPPDDQKEYIHRVGRTARGSEGKGKALLFLLPEESGFLAKLKEKKITLNEYEFPKNKIIKIQNQLEKLISKNYYLHKSAKDAFKSYVLSYASHSLKDIYDINTLDLAGVAKAFGFTTTPHVNLSMFKNSGKSIRKRPLKNKHGFSESKPYGSGGDKRQFTY